MLSFESPFCTEVIIYFTAKQFHIQRKDANAKRNCNKNGLYQTTFHAGVFVGTKCCLTSDNKCYYWASLHCRLHFTFSLALLRPFSHPPRLTLVGAVQHPAGGLRRGRQISFGGDLSRPSSETAAVGSSEEESVGAQCYARPCVDRLCCTRLGASPPGGRASPGKPPTWPYIGDGMGMKSLAVNSSNVWYDTANCSRELHLGTVVDGMIFWQSAN